MKKRSGWGIHSFLAQLASGVDLFPGLEQVTLVGVDPDGIMHLTHLLFYVRVDIYSTFALLTRLSSRKRGSTKASASWTPVTPPTA